MNNFIEKKGTAVKDNRVPFAKDSNLIIKVYMQFLSVYFLIFALIAFFITNEQDFIGKYLNILLSPSKLVTDYFALGGLSCTLFNAGICGLFTNFIIYVSKTRPNATTFAGYLLVVAHCFYGLNIINMIPSILGVILYCAVKKSAFSENVHIALFSTAIGPFMSDFLFRYFYFVSGVQAVVMGVIFSLALGIIVGFLLPAILPGTTKMHRGFNMYKAGLALGIFGIFVHSFFYTSLGFNTPSVITIDNPEYYAMPFAYREFMNAFFLILFGATLLVGFVLNGKSFKGYKRLIHSTGYGTDFFDKFKMPLCLINFAIYGFCIILYLNLIMLLPEIFNFLPKGVGFTGATVGVVFAALTFSADGQQPRTVAPIVLGYALLSVIVIIFSLCFNKAVPWTLSTQCYINGLAFATGLCPFAGKYGWKVGVVAGFLSAVICASTASMHGGFVLYNGGFTAGLTALVLLPILDFYKINPKFDDDTDD